MRQINIQEEARDGQGMVYVLEEIIKHLENGNTSGVDPTWELVGTDESGDEDGM